nr:Gag-Pol polyprotein [Tanacetum cinerariifolium]
MKAILRMDKCLAAIVERPDEVTNDNKWDEMDGNAIANLYMALTDGVFLTSNVLSDYLVFDDVTATILEEENRRNNRENMQASLRQVEALAVTRGRSMEPGSSGSNNHGKSKTRKKKNFSGCKRRQIFFADVWLFGMGATFHMITRREWFHQYKPISRGRSMYNCNDHELKIIGIRSIMVKMHDGTIHTIRDVQHLEGLKKNLLSLGKLDDPCCKVAIQNKIMKIIKGALLLMKGEKVAANLYELKGEIIEEAEASVALHSLSHRVTVTCHQKLGHISQQGMKILIERNLLPGLTKVSLPFCICLSMRGAKYFISFVDDYSRRCWVYPIKKSDVFKVLKAYKARVELDSRKKIKCFRMDNGGKYTSDEFDTFCKHEGIKRQFITAYTPQQNEVAEWMNKTWFERSRAMLATTRLEKSFWAESVNTACYVINRSSTTAVELKIPIEMWTQKPVNYSDLNLFGSPVYVMYNTQETTKLDPKFRKCLFLGYANGVKGYHLWDPAAHKVFFTRDVVFMEDKIEKMKKVVALQGKLHQYKWKINFSQMILWKLHLSTRRRGVGTRDLILSSLALDITDYMQTPVLFQE